LEQQVTDLTDEVQVLERWAVDSISFEVSRERDDVQWMM
jgi:hypothetical protein